MKVTAFMKFARLQWAKHIIRKEEHHIIKKSCNKQFIARKE
jgi:hypothetical protein